MKKAILTILMVVVAVVCQAQHPQKEIEVDLPKMYEEVDEAIKQSLKYVQEYEDKLAEVKQSISKAETDDQRFLLLMQVCKLYEGFNGDSALIYSLRCTKVAQKMGLTDVETEYQARTAYLCTFLGSQSEALTLLGRIDRKQLNMEGLGIYFRAYLTAYENLADNCKVPEMRQAFRAQYLGYRDSLLQSVPEDSELYYFYREDQLIKEGKTDEALKMNDQRLNQSTANSHLDAIIAYSRYRIFEKRGDKQMALYWLCRSALADIRNAVMDQMSLISLAKELDANGDFDRASQYISFTWECNRRYSPHMRSWQIAPLLTAIENNYQSRIDEKNRQLTMYTIAFLVLVIALLARHMFRRKKKASEQEGE